MSRSNGVRSVRDTAVVFATLLWIVTACGDEPQTRGIAFTNVTVIDATSGVRRDQTVKVVGDKIFEVGAVSDVSDRFEIIDGTGKFLIPGLWDMHVHLTYDDRFTEIMPEAFIRYGVTSVRDTGGLLDRLKPVVDTMRMPDAIAPRVFFSGPLLDGELVVYGGVDRPEIGVENTTAAVAESNVKMLHDQGVDFIKIYELVSPDVFNALVEAAAVYELPIAAHVPLAMRASKVGPRVNSMEHLRNVELDCAANFAELHETRLKRLAVAQDVTGFQLRSSLHELQRIPAFEALDDARCNAVIEALQSTLQVPTARLIALNLYPAFEREDWNEALAEMPAQIQEAWGEPPDRVDPDPRKRDTRYARYGLEMISRMHGANVPIAAGTDTPIAHAIPGYSLHNELEILVAAGMAPLDALASATLRPAEFFALENELGAIAPGMHADLVLLDANPLSDIRNTRRIRLVMTRGRVIR